MPRARGRSHRAAEAASVAGSVPLRLGKPVELRLSQGVQAHVGLVHGGVRGRNGAALLFRRRLQREAVLTVGSKNVEMGVEDGLGCRSKRSRARDGRKRLSRSARSSSTSRNWSSANMTLVPGKAALLASAVFIMVP